MNASPLIDGLTVKESRAVNNLVQGAPTKSAAVLAAGYASNAPESWRVFNRPKVRNALAAALEAKRIDEEGLAKKAKQLLNAKRVVVGKGGILHEVDDNATQVRMWELIAKVNGYLQENNLQINLLGDDDKREILERALGNTDRYRNALAVVIETESQVSHSQAGTEVKENLSESSVVRSSSGGGGDIPMASVNISPLPAADISENEISKAKVD